jgi:hypothetical protein
LGSDLEAAGRPQLHVAQLVLSLVYHRTLDHARQPGAALEHARLRVTREPKASRACPNEQKGKNDDR